eukprot:COSAG02_NODE_25654_length_652_cov_1.622061_1_plen_40_part_10
MSLCVAFDRLRCKAPRTHQATRHNNNIVTAGASAVPDRIR